MASQASSIRRKRRPRLHYNHMLMRQALVRLEDLKQQPQEPMLRVIRDHTSLTRTFPSPEALLRLAKLMPAQDFLAVALPKDFRSWVAAIDKWRVAKLAGKWWPDRPNAPLFYTAILFGQAQLCGVQTSDVYRSLSRSFEVDSKRSAFYNWWKERDENKLLLRIMTRHAMTGFYGLELDPLKLTPRAVEKFKYACGRCGSVGVCICIFASVLNAAGAERRWDVALDAAERMLLAPLT